MNKLCQRCEKACKQEDSVKILECKKFTPAPVQIEFKFKFGKVNHCSPTKK